MMSATGRRYPPLVIGPLPYASVSLERGHRRLGIAFTTIRLSRSITRACQHFGPRLLEAEYLPSYQGSLPAGSLALEAEVPAPCDGRAGRHDHRMREKPARSGHPPTAASPSRCYLRLPSVNEGSRQRQAHRPPGTLAPRVAPRAHPRILTIAPETRS